MRFVNPAGLALLALAIPVVILHMLRPRRPATDVSSTFLWREVSRPSTAATPWQRLRPSLLLVLQLLAVALLAVGAARPVRPTEAPLAEHTVFIIDASASMRATDWRPDRVERAKEEARRLRGELPSGGLASLVVAGPEARVLLSVSADRGAFEDAVAMVRASEARADFEGAFLLAQSLETPGIPIGFVLLSDGGLEPEQRRLVPAGTRYIAVGLESANAGVSRLAVSSGGSGLHATITVRNTGEVEMTRRLRVDVDGRSAATTDLVMRPGEVIERGSDLPAGERVVAAIEGGDLLPTDDRAYAVAETRPDVRVLVAGEPNPFWDTLLASIPGVVVERTSTADPANGFDLAIYDGVDPPPEVGAPFVAVAPPSGLRDLPVVGEVERPPVTLVRAADPMLDGLDLSAVAIAKAQRLDVRGDEVLVGAEGAPLLVRGTRAGRPFLYFAFALADSNLPVQVAFPILGDRLVGTFAGRTAAPAALQAGDTLPVEVGIGAVVEAPDGTRTTLEAGERAPAAGEAGFWVVREPSGAARTFAVNAHPAESFIAPLDRLEVPPRPRRAGEPPPAGETPLGPWVAAALGVVLAGELVASRRSSGVSRRQWRWAYAVRAAIALLVLGAALGVALPRRGTSVATVFVLDASDSMGPGGRSEAATWVREALDAKPAGARAGVVAFGGEARVDVAVRSEVTFERPQVEVDASRTNLAGALRMAGAVLPSDARRRVVVVSDGRPTEGDARAEAQRLREAGVAVDVHRVGAAGGPDVAVAGLDAPDVVRSGEAFEVAAALVSTVAQPVRLTLFRGGEVVEERSVEAEAGRTSVRFRQSPVEGDLHRFRLVVSADGNAVGANDVGLAAVRVEGEARVLVVEGEPGEAAALVTALRAGGVSVDVTDPSGVGTVDELALYTSIVLADVGARTLGAGQVDALRGAVRDLGRGLVAVAGDRSFALGSYLGTDLEELLPVRSEARDPQRRASVAQVLAIDTSGSMGACHCDPRSPDSGFGGTRDEGGQNKTDISRAAAARAVSAMRETDQIGVLAFNTEQRWIIPLGRLPGEQVIEEGLARLTPAGGTNVHEPLRVAGEALAEANAALRHVILFTDGWTNQEGLAAEAGRLRERGITVSVLATGEGPGDELRDLAESGGGRFYPGTDLSQVPQIMMEETIIASRSYVNEGEFLPTVTAEGPATAQLTEAPPILGYLASTPKAPATTLLEVGEEADPLLATWQTGLGRVTAWTSDASLRWASTWAKWDGYADFWSAVVKDTFPASEGGATARAAVRGDRLRILLEREERWPDGVSATARVSGPGLDGVSVPLERTSPETLSGEVPAAGAGTYSVGVEASVDGDTLAVAATTVTRSYSPEYEIDAADPGLLERLSRASGGRGEIATSAAFDTAGLEAGRASVPLAAWLLLAAALLWPLDVALRRVAFAQAAPPAVAATRGLAVKARERLSRRRRRRRRVGRTAATAAERRMPPETVRRLLDRKRGGSGADDTESS